MLFVKHLYLSEDRGTTFWATLGTNWAIFTHYHLVTLLQIITSGLNNIFAEGFKNAKNRLSIISFNFSTEKLSILGQQFGVN